MCSKIMRWARDQKTFVISITTYKAARSKVITLPPPIHDMLGNPRYIKLIIRGDKIIMEGTDTKKPSKS